MTQTGFIETEEQHALRKAVAAMAANYGQDYYLEKARSGGHTDELWNEAGKLGFTCCIMPSSNLRQLNRFESPELRGASSLKDLWKMIF